MTAKHFDRGRRRSKTAFYTALLSALLVAFLQPLFAAVLPAIHLQPQLLGQTNSVTRVVVRHSRGLSGINLTCSLLGCQVVRGIGDPGGQLFVVQSSGLLSSALFLAQLTAADGVLNAEIDQTVNTPTGPMAPMDGWPSYANDRTPIDYYGATVWEGYVLQTPNQIVRTSVTQSAFGTTGAGVTVAMIDTGIDPNNSVLAPHLVYGYDFTRNSDGGSEMGDLPQVVPSVDPTSPQPAQLNQSTAGVIDQSTAGVIDQTKYSAFGHGTMTAGIVHLVAPNASLMPLKAFGANGTGYESDVLRAIYYAVNHQAKVLSMSFEFASPSVELATAITYATGNNVICVGSAGNSGSMTIVYPSGLPNVIDVASTSNSNTPSSFSNYGTPPVWISAPGEAVMTTYPYQTYAVGWGTSFSTPFVAGTVAMMASLAPHNSNLLNQTTAAQALSHAQPIPQTQYGFGVLDTYQAVQAWQAFLSLNGGIPSLGSPIP